MKYKIAAFFAGRNGMDDLSGIIVWPSLIIMLLSGFISTQWLRMALYWVCFAAIIYACYRASSKKRDKRQAEKYAYVSWKNRLKQRWTQRKTHKFYHCPKCKTVLRVPKGKGKINITCRSCGEKFIKNT